jgi:hypothetical protein
MHTLRVIPAYLGVLVRLSAGLVKPRQCVADVDGG